MEAVGCSLKMPESGTSPEIAVPFGIHLFTDHLPCTSNFHIIPNLVSAKV